MMRTQKIVVAAASTVLALGLGASVVSAAPPVGAGSGAKPAGVACQQAGIGTLQSLGLLPSVAANGIEVAGVGVLPFATVLKLHRTDPALFQTGGVSVVVGGEEVAATWCDGV
jgi:hypothetical protein